tara:strand:- start:39 stop:434 length:396 start_codon:yes stop_codon:yes gene_type:complete
MTTELPINLKTALEIDLFEDIKFGDLKIGDNHLFTEDTDYYDICLDIEIENFEPTFKEIQEQKKKIEEKQGCEVSLSFRYADIKTVIKFELNNKKFEKTYIYYCNSPMGINISQIWEYAEIYNAEEEDDEN